MPKTKALTIIESKPQSLKQMIKSEVENRKLLTEFISHHMKSGVDYSKIHIGRNCPDKYNCTFEKAPSHWSKDCLLKPGAEKFTPLMHLRPEFKKDVETWEMAGSKAGLFCYLCYLKNNKDEIVGEGRGSCSIEEKGNPNIAIKIAEKRAKMDAVLSTGGLSDFFTQDLDDMPIDVATKSTPSAQPARPISEKQLAFLHTLLTKKGKDKEEIKAYYKIESMKDLSAEHASRMIEKLLMMPDVPQTPKETEDTADQREPEVQEEVDIDEVSKAIDQMEGQNA